jgi:hypothetical protein
MLTDAHEETRKAITTDLSHQHNTEDKGFLSCVVNGEKSASTTLNSNLSSNCWNITLPRKKKFKSVASAEKIMVTVIWVEKGVIL